MAIIGMAIFVIGGIGGVVLGNQYPAITGDLISQLETSFNWILMLSTWAGAFITGMIFIALDEISGGIKQILSRMGTMEEKQNKAETVTKSLLADKLTTGSPAFGKIKCRSCGKEYSADRSNCPHCGAR